MSNDLVLRNRQRTRAIDLRLLRRITRTLLTEHVQGAPFVLGIHFVTELEMAQLNEHFLRHRGSTDVLTFDHAGSQHGARSTEHRSPLHGEIFISVDDAIAHARRFRTTWQHEIVRYLIHGLLHIQGHDDLEPTARRAMKRIENRLLERIARRFPLRQLARRPHPSAKSAASGKAGRLNA